MADPRFFERSGPFTLGALAAKLGGELSAPSATDLLVTDIAALDDATSDEIAAVSDPRHAAAVARSRAGALLTSPALVERLRDGPENARPLVIVAHPRAALRELALYFHPRQALAPGVAPSAVIAANARIDPSCRIEAGVVIGAGARLGPGCHVEPNAVIGAGVELGAGCVVGANASIDFAILGARVEVYPGARIGTAGFGFLPGPRGPVRIPQLGRVLIGDDVEIGANCTIDRGTLGDTVIGAGTVLDNLVHIAHNVRVGRGCVIAGQAGIAGSAIIGDGVMMGGQSGTSDHVTLGAGSRVAGGGSVIRDVAPGETVGGYPALPVRLWHRQTIGLAKLFRRAGHKE